MKDLIFASLKFKSGNTLKSTKSNLKEEELEAVARRCPSKSISYENPCAGVSF